ncbi:MAG TPA: helix-turn-helix transcriptional regulator [bacterium]|nr:helix-turn-helix transcriptional regulator [bacterium]
MVRSVFSPAYRHFRRRLIDARKRSNLTQAVLAKRLGRPQSFVAKYEQGERRIDVIEFLEIADALRLDPGTFVSTLHRAIRKKRPRRE